MSSLSPWDHPTPDRNRFRAYSSLLRIRHGSQVDERSEIEHGLEGGDNLLACEDADSVVAQPLTSFDDAKLREAFQDRVAELVSDAKGGYHVAATLLMDAPEGLALVVAKNEGLNTRDKDFLQKVQLFLRHVSKTSRSRDDDQRQALWNEMLTYSDVRLCDWTTDFQRIAGKFVEKCPENSGDCFETKALRYTISDLLEILYEGEKSDVVKVAHRIWSFYEQEDFVKVCLNYPDLARGLRLSIGFLGRLHIGWEVMVRAAERLNGFENLTIHPLFWSGKQLKRSKGKDGDTPWTLGRTFQSLSLPLDEATVKLLSGPKWTKHKLIAEFDKTQKQSPRAHAEVQLVMYAIQQGHWEDEKSHYIGCSKRSCFLCWQFMKALGTFRARASHGKIYSAWDIPATEDISEKRSDILNSALKSVEKNLKKELGAKRRHIHQPAKESTVGGSSIVTRLPLHNSPQISRLVQQHLSNQRQVARNRVLRESDDVLDDDNLDVLTEELLEQELSDTNNSNPSDVSSAIVDKSGPCRWCEQQTERRCPHCDKAWYCSSTCAAKSVSHRFECAGRALTTADYLERAVLDDRIPDDPHTMEDFGFARCQTWNEKSHLLGLYIGLIKKLDVDSPDLDDWRRNGTLVENIISMYTEYPEGKRGGYFPWFLEHTYLLDGTSTVERAEPENPLDGVVHKSANFLQPEDRHKHLAEIEPSEKRDAFLFFAMVREHMHPGPWGPADLWYSFGFCACSDEHEENELGGLYSKLLNGNKFRADYDRSLGLEPRHPAIPSATFEEFWHAFRDGKLMQLMDQYGHREGRRRFGQLKSFLAIRPTDPHPPIWRLCHYLAFDAAAINLPTEAETGAREYGITSEMSPRMKMELRDFYESLLREADPLEIDQARAQGRLFDYAQEHISKIDAGIARILKGLK